jgi:dTDP-L-rhamnose 4-epimerase
MQWVHVRDLAEAVVLAGTRPEAAGDAFNIAGNETVTRRDLIAMVHSVAGRSSWANPLPIVRSGSGGTYFPKYDISKAQTLLGYTPQVTLQDGLAEIIAALDQQGLIDRQPALRLGWLSWYWR